MGPVGFSVEQQDLIWAMWRRGDAIREMERTLLTLSSKELSMAEQRRQVVLAVIGDGLAHAAEDAKLGPRQAGRSIAPSPTA